MTIKLERFAAWLVAQRELAVESELKRWDCPVSEKRKLYLRWKWRNNNSNSNMARESAWQHTYLSCRENLNAVDPTGKPIELKEEDARFYNMVIRFENECRRQWRNATEREVMREQAEKEYTDKFNKAWGK